MRLTTRLVAVLALVFAGLVAIDGVLEFEQERVLIRDGMTRDARVLGDALRSVLADVWRTNGMQRALELIDDVNEGASDVLVRWVWLDAARGDPAAPVCPSAADVRTSLEMGGLVEATTAGAPRLYAYFPVETGAGRDGALELSQPTTALSRRAARILRRSVTQLAALFAIAALAVYFIGVRLIGRPLSRLMAKIDRVGRGDLSHPVELRGHNELAQLADGLNTMCGRLAEAQERVAQETAARIAAIDHARHADRLRTVGQLASGMAHELGTPLNVVDGRAALIAEDRLDAAQVRESAEIIRAQADRMAGIIRQLLVFARRGSAAREPVDVEQTARQSIAMLESVARNKRVTVELSSGENGGAVACCSASGLQQVLTNLILNAIHASHEGGAVRVDVRIERAVPAEDPQAEPEPWVRVEVRDAGEGIAADALPRVFEPFFTTKGVGEGTGLGLSIVHGIVRDHGGWIAVTSEPGEGSCFAVYLPVSDS